MNQLMATAGGAVLAVLVYLKFFRRVKAGSLKGKVVLITGASSGVGEACAHAFYKAGAKIILSARREEELKRVRQNLLDLNQPKSPAEPKILLLDLAESATIEPKAAEALLLFGEVDVLINNGGVSYRGEIVDTDMVVDRRVMEVNYFGQIALTKALIPHMLARKSGHVVVVSSLQGKISLPFRSCYGASKHALDAFFNCLRAEVAQDNVGVSIVSPAYIRTSLSLNAVTGDGSSYAKMDETTASGMETSYVASQVLNSVCFNEKDVILSSLFLRLVTYLKNMFPNIFAGFMAKRASKERQKQN